jgi:hypothetical protein
MVGAMVMTHDGEFLFTGDYGGNLKQISLTGKIYFVNGFRYDCGQRLQADSRCQQYFDDGCEQG